MENADDDGGTGNDAIYPSISLCQSVDFEFTPTALKSLQASFIPLSLPLSLSYTIPAILYELYIV